MAEALSDDDTHVVKLRMNVDGGGKVHLCMTIVKAVESEVKVLTVHKEVTDGALGGQLKVNTPEEVELCTLQARNHELELALAESAEQLANGKAHAEELQQLLDMPRADLRKKLHAAVQRLAHVNRCQSSIDRQHAAGVEAFIKKFFRREIKVTFPQCSGSSPRGSRAGSPRVSGSGSPRASGSPRFALETISSLNRTVPQAAARKQ